MAVKGAKPTILIIPGFWEGPRVFDQVAEKLRGYDYTVVVHHHRSTGTKPPGNPSYNDDVRGVRESIQAILDADPTADIVMVCHSAGGYIGAAATEGLDAEAWRKTHDGKGGIVRFVFVTAGLVPVGTELKHPAPFMDLIDDCYVCKSPEHLLFSDMSSEEAAPYLAMFDTQPAPNWDGTVEYGGWQTIPSVYLVCDGDNVLPPALQLQFAQVAGSTVEHCSAAHMVQVSQPNVLVQTVRKAAGEVV